MRIVLRERKRERERNLFVARPSEIREACCTHRGPQWLPILVKSQST